MKDFIIVLCHAVCMFICGFGVIAIIGQLGEIKRDIKAIEDKLYDIEKWLTDREGDQDHGHPKGYRHR